MFKSLLLISALSTLSTPVQNNVVEQDGIAITYKFETNEVNSVDDLVVGNLYHYTVDLSNFTGAFIRCYGVYNLMNQRGNNVMCDSGELIKGFNNNGTSIAFINSNPDKNAFNVYNLPSIVEFDVVFGELLQEDDVNRYSISTYNEIVSVERVYPDNIMGNVSEFIDDYILAGIPLIDSVTNDINGVNVTLKAWLNTSICIVLAVLLITLLVVFVKWLFKLFAGLLYR